MANCFPNVNSPENIPVFLNLTAGLTSAQRADLARRIAVNGFVLLSGSVLVGTHVLAFFGISLAAVQVGGGMVLIASGWSLLNQKTITDGPGLVARNAAAADISKWAFYPLTLPLTVGPGSISVAITVGANRPDSTAAGWALPAATLLGCGVIALSIFLSYRCAEFLGRVLGDIAMNVVVRLSAFIVVCIGVQIFWNGTSVLIHSGPRMLP